MKSNLLKLGNVYPFFLNNTDLGSYYLYQLVSPGVDKHIDPMLTLKKIAEKTVGNDFHASEKNMFDTDLLSTILRSKKGVCKKGVKFIVQGLTSNLKDGKMYRERIDEGENLVMETNGFPWFAMDPDIERSVIINLRDSLRWSRYKFRPGSYVDILTKPQEFVMCKIIGDDKKIQLKPMSTYECGDIELKNPMPVNPKLDLPLSVYEGEKKESRLNQDIRSCEWRGLV